MNSEIAPSYRRHLRSRSDLLFESRHRLTWRGFCVGCFLSLFLGMIAGQMLTMGLWLTIDYFTGHTNNWVFGWG